MVKSQTYLNAENDPRKPMEERLHFRTLRQKLQGEDPDHPYELYESFGIKQLRARLEADCNSGIIKPDSVYYKRLQEMLTKRNLSYEKNGSKMGKQLTREKNPVYFA